VIGAESEFTDFFLPWDIVIPSLDRSVHRIMRYTQFAAAAYVDSCATPPYGSSVPQYFKDDFTDT
jgi:hypothetical protein